MIAAIVQARVSSTRFPGKIFAELSGKPLIHHVFERLRWSGKLEVVMLATTVNPADDRLEDWAKSNSILCFRGSENDVLERFYKAADSISADTIVRVTSDDPFKDPQVIDATIEMLQKHGLDFAYNNNPPSFPEGLDAEVFTFEALKASQEGSRDPFEREHVTQYMFHNPARFRQKNHSYSRDISNLRWTIDTAEDLAMARAVYTELYQEGKIFLLDDILHLLAKMPEIAHMNSSVERSHLYRKDSGSRS